MKIFFSEGLGFGIGRSGFYETKAFRRSLTIPGEAITAFSGRSFSAKGADFYLQFKNGREEKYPFDTWEIAGFNTYTTFTASLSIFDGAIVVNNVLNISYVFNSESNTSNVVVTPLNEGSSIQPSGNAFTGSVSSVLKSNQTASTEKYTRGDFEGNVDRVGTGVLSGLVDTVFLKKETDRFFMVNWELPESPNLSSHRSTLTETKLGEFSKATVSIAYFFPPLEAPVTPDGIVYGSGSYRVRGEMVTRLNEPLIRNLENPSFGAWGARGMGCYPNRKGSVLLSDEITSKKYKDGSGIFDPEDEDALDDFSFKRNAGGLFDLWQSIRAIPGSDSCSVSAAKFWSCGGTYRFTISVIDYDGNTWRSDILNVSPGNSATLDYNALRGESGAGGNGFFPVVTGFEQFIDGEWVDLEGYVPEDYPAGFQVFDQLGETPGEIKYVEYYDVELDEYMEIEVTTLVLLGIATRHGTLWGHRSIDNTNPLKRWKTKTVEKEWYY